MNNNQFRPFCFLLAVVVFIFALTCTVNGQTPKGENVVDIWEQEVLRPGEGSYGFVPSWFCLLKVEDRHSRQFLGSGSFITDRIILTCNHNVEGSKKVTVKNGTGFVFESVEILLRSPKLDLALLKVNDKVIPYHSTLRISDENFKPEGTVHSYGFVPADDAICRYEGKLSGNSYGRPNFPGVVSHAHTAKVVQGMSGGPLLDSSLEIVGVNTHSSKQTGSLATTLVRVQWFLDQLEESKVE